jgi:hypothetical protein
MAIKMLSFDGSPEQIGSAHGETLRNEIQGCLELWLEDLRNAHGMPPLDLIKRFVAETSLAETAERLTPDLYEELGAIARAAHVDPEVLWAWNNLDEFWWFIGGLLQAGTPNDPACSCVAIAAGPSGRPLIAQNMDLMSFMDWDPFVLNAKPADGLEMWALVNPGVLAQCGCNEDGVAVCVNEMIMLRPSGSGLPVTFRVRSILGRRDLGSVRSFMHDTPHASGQNYLVATPEGVLDFECSAGKVVEIGEGDQVVVHTNHPLVNDDVVREVVRQNSFDRQSYLASTLEPGSDRFAVQAALSDRSTPVCKIGDEGRTYAAMVMELTTPPSVWMSVGPPKPDNFQAIIP